MNLYTKSIVFILLSILLVNCKRDKSKQINDLKESIQGVWILESSEFDIDTSDAFATDKIGNTMNSEMSLLLKTELKLDDNNFMVIGKLDSIDLVKEGTYQVDIRDTNYITFLFKDTDEATVEFEYTIDIQNDSLFIIYDNLENISEYLQSKTFTDKNIQLMFGIKNRDSIQINSATIKRIYTRKQ